MQRKLNTLHVLATIGLPACMTFLQSCNDDSYKYPPVTTDIVCIRTDASSHTTTIITDNGRTLEITNPIATSTPDTLYRCMAVYTTDEQTATLYSLTNVFSPTPVPHEALSVHTAVPVKFISSWLSGGYINLHIGIPTMLNDGHAFAFSEDSITSTASEGVRILHISLVHEAPADDPPSFTEEAYMSIPLKGYSEILTETDSVKFRINTTDGWKVIGYRFKW